jgi:hypothetical protein
VDATTAKFPLESVVSFGGGVPAYGGIEGRRAASKIRNGVYKSWIKRIGHRGDLDGAVVWRADQCVIKVVIDEMGLVGRDARGISHFSGEFIATREFGLRL